MLQQYSCALDSMKRKLVALSDEVAFYSSKKKDSDKFKKLTEEYERRLRDTELMHRSEIRKIRDSDMISTSTNVQSPISKRISYQSPEQR